MAGLSGDEYSEIKGRLVDYIDHLEHQRDSSKAAAEAYPSMAVRVLGEAEVYGDIATDLREMISHWPK